jgi:hypothetical protein
MKRYIIIFVLLVLALGLNAQRTNTGSRGKTTTTSASKSSEDDKKSKPSNTERRTREASPVKPDASTKKREESPARTTNTERKAEPANNESRNRKTPDVRTISTPGKAETPAVENRSSQTKTTPSVTNARKTEQEPTRKVSTANQEQERKAGGLTPREREAGNRNSGNVRPAERNRTDGNSREVNAERNREYVPRTEQVYVEKRQAYRTPDRPRTARTVNQSTNYDSHPVEYRRNYFPYSEPRRIEIIWDVNMYNEYRYLYPHYDYWYYPYGYRIQTISAYDASRYIGEVARIYGKVFEVWYERQSDEYTLYFGGPYPYQDFSVIVPGKHARRYSYHPERYFSNRNIAVTGLVSLWEDRPEMIIRKRSQMEIYF